MTLPICQGHVGFTNHTFQSLINSQGVSPGSITISLNLIIDCVYDFCMLNSQFSAAWISMILAFGLSLECLMYHISARSCNVLTNISFFILSSMNPFASHTTFTMNQNWSVSSFPTHFNTNNFISLAILNYGGGWGGVGRDGGEDGKLVVVQVEVVCVEFAALSDWSHLLLKILQALPHFLVEVKSRG